MRVLVPYRTVQRTYPTVRGWFSLDWIGVKQVRLILQYGLYHHSPKKFEILPVFLALLWRGC